MAVLRGRDTEARLERAVERPDRAVAAVERDGEYRQVGLGIVGEARGGLAQPVVVQELVEVAVTEVPVDRPPQEVLLRAQRLRERADAELLALPQPIARH